jgi:acetyltransferase-like isoleucine patch superfamily enzyme
MRIKNWIYNKIFGLVKPRMINGYHNGGKFLVRTRISNSTFIDHPQNLKIADNVHIGHHNFIEASHHITIEEGCQITNFVSITTHSSHISIRLYGDLIPQENPPKGYLIGPIKIGKYTVIGPYALIMPGTTIGKGCIVHAYSMVKGEFPDFSIIKGNPAKVIGDTRELDAPYLKKYPEMQEWYNQWVISSK